MKREVNNSRELLSMTEDWVMQFNFIQLEVLEKMAEGVLFEYIRPLPPNYDEFLDTYNLWDEFAESYEDKKGFCEKQMEFDDWESEAKGENYPMWNTCFEFKNYTSEEILEAAEKAGFGIIEGLEPFNEILFVAGAGYSFYGSHWIPLFLELPWNSDIKTQVINKNISYKSL